jgi:hypothetical protein
MYRRNRRRETSGGTVFGLYFGTEALFEIRMITTGSTDMGERAFLTPGTTVIPAQAGIHSEAGYPRL